MKNTIKIKHADEKTDVIAKVHFTSDINNTTLEYKYQGMTYGRSLELYEAVELGIIDCPHFSIYPNMGFDNVVIGDQCMDCGKIL